MNKRHAGASALMALALLAGCSDVNQLLGNEESVDYKSTRRGDPLSIPPDLTQANNDPRYKAPASGTATYSQFQQQGLQQQASAGQNTNVLPERADMRVERDGDLRWLVIERPPEQLFPKVVDFWTDTGFTVSVNNPQAGIIETDWAENRAKIPESWLRQVLGSVLETAWDSGEREKFRTRVERVNGHTEIYITHNQMLEKRVGSDGGQVQWTHGKEDPASDEDMFNQLDRLLRADDGKSTFTLAFSVSNHSPWEYPAGRIEPVGDPASVDNTVRYADWAMGQFFDKARKAPYWDNTVFLVIADHDSRVYGANLVPVRHFQIPALILGGTVPPRSDDRIVSQIDMGPTLLSLIGLDNVNPMLGADLTQRDPNRAIMQYGDNFGYLKGDSLLVIEPGKDPREYRYTAAASMRDEKYIPIDIDPALRDEALAFALWPSWAYREERYKLPK